MLNVDWCLLFNLLPQLLWHIDNRTVQLNQRCPCLYAASVYLDVLIVSGYAAHLKPTNTASLQTEECVIRGLELLLVNTIDSIIQLFFIHCSYKTFYESFFFKAVNLFYAFINYCEIVCNS